MAEYYVNPNPGYVSPTAANPMANVAAAANVAPFMTAPANIAPFMAAPVKKPILDADAILVLFILLVIILRVCH
ncbi:hypothetical protein [Paenibacillus alkalitolerans]|uniref:hypothetical protein n=1 Tax=Paenibacillus alkalitolerans TaxID=2799335 RepID=UPI0018F3E3E9|nr:hypothetical protein [Paenibacillus alkalitolerans]